MTWEKVVTKGLRRREFLKIFLLALGATAAGSFLYPLGRFLAPGSGSAEARHVTLKKSEIPPGEAKELVYGGTPILIINRPAKGFVAFSRVCTHLGCLVDNSKADGRILCPCHGAFFDLQGNVLSGPPSKPLLPISLKVEAESVVIG